MEIQSIKVFIYMKHQGPRQTKVPVRCIRCCLERLTLADPRPRVVTQARTWKKANKKIKKWSWLTPVLDRREIFPCSPNHKLESDRPCEWTSLSWIHLHSDASNLLIAGGLLNNIPPKHRVLARKKCLSYTLWDADFWNGLLSNS